MAEGMSTAFSFVWKEPFASYATFAVKSDAGSMGLAEVVLMSVL